MGRGLGHSCKEPLGRGGVCGSGCSPDEISEAPVQVHGMGRAAEHGQNALQVQKLQLLAVTGEEQDQHTNAGMIRGRIKVRVL